MRKHNYDIFKALLIFLVVLGHMLTTYDYLPKASYNELLSCIYIIHMPMFFIVSGYFSKKVSNSRLLKYLLVFLFMNTSFSLFNFLFYGQIDVFSILYSSWFILLLFLYRVIIRNKTINRVLSDKYSIIIVFFVSLCSGLVFNNIEIVRFFSFFYFFVIGYKYDLRSNIKNCKRFLLISMVLYVLLLSINIPYDFYMVSYYNNQYEIIIRGITFILNPMLFIAIINLIPNKKIPIVSNIGNNSLYIYAIHRIPTILLSYYLYPSKYYLIISIVISIFICISIGCLSKYLDLLFKSKYLLILSVLLIIIPFMGLFENHEMSVIEYKKLDNSITIGYIGDLILLEDQLKLSNNNFDYMFNNMKEKFNNTDYVFGVLEGPVDDNSEYSYGNYSDNKVLKLNYPTGFLKSIENSGVDFVTISNNHILDRGIDAYINTLVNLNNSKLDYTGTKNNYKIINIKGLKIGVLSYTYGLNYLDKNDYKEYTNFLVSPDSKEFNKYKKQIHKDFVKLKKANVDMIIVMPHYGTEFNYRIDLFQKKWNDFFIKEGANIILGDHSHVIEPIEYKNNSIIINSPGNYINSYIGHDSDISMYVKLYIDKNNHKIITTEITPIIATKDIEGKYYPKLLKNTTNKNKARVLGIISNVIFKNKISKINNSYYYYPNKKYKYDNRYKLELTNNDKKSIVYRKIEENNNICFIGDSITNGYKNGYKPWYIPLMNNFDKNIINISKESYTSHDIINEFSNKIIESNCDLSIINIGTNDIRYNKESVKNYINNIKKIVELTQGEDIVLAPWQTTENDYNISSNDNEKRLLYNIYNDELKKLSNAYYVDPNPYIKKVINHNNEEDYLIDGVHPNSGEGIKLYSFAVMRGDYY